DIADTIELPADYQREQQLFINLIDNAVAFLRNQEQGKLAIQAWQSKDAVVIQVHNNGTRIDSALTGEVLFQ
ncbi:ATP-binding protein, partial [Marinomonas arenicola]